MERPHSAPWLFVGVTVGDSSEGGGQAPPQERQLVHLERSEHNQVLHNTRAGTS